MDRRPLSSTRPRLGFRAVTPLFVAAVLIASTRLAGADAPAPVPVGWTTTVAAAEATMDKGRIFTCEGAGCPDGGLSCLHAVAPESPDKQRTLRVKDMLRPKSFPWPEFETWILAKAGMMRPSLESLAVRDDKPLSTDEEATAKRLSERPFVWKRYGAQVTEGGYALPVAMWVAPGNRLNTVVCVTPLETYRFATARIDAFLDAMNVSPPLEGAEPGTLQSPRF